MRDESKRVTVLIGESLFREVVRRASENCRTNIREIAYLCRLSQEAKALDPDDSTWESDTPKTGRVNVTEDILALVDPVVKKYGCSTAQGLRMLIHAGLTVERTR